MANGKQSYNISVRLLTKQFKSGINGLKTQVKQFGNYLKGVFAFGGMTAFGRQMIQVSSDFEDAMARVKAVSGATEEGFKMMREEAEKLGKTTRYSASEAAGALENLTRNGLTAEQATKVLGDVLSFAGANAIDLAQSADIVTNTMNMFGMSVQEAQRITDVMSSTAANSATDVSLLYEAMVNAAPAAHTMGFSIEETSAAIGALAQKGVKGADAGTQLRMALVKMADPKIVAKMQEMGVSIDENSMKAEGLTGTIERLKDANLSLTQLITIFSQRGAAGIQQLISGYEDYQRILGVVGDSAGKTSDMFKQGIGSTKNELATLKSAWEGFLITMGSKTQGVVNGTIGYITHLIKDFETVGGTIKNLAVVLIPTLGKNIVSALAKASVGVKGFGAAIKAAFSTNIVGLITTAISGLIMLIDKLTAKGRELRKEVKDAKKDMDDLAVQTEKTNGKLQDMYRLLDEKGKGGLTEVVKLATECFGDFAASIKEAADEAARTENYDKLKGKLAEIAEAQQAINANVALDRLYHAQIALGGHRLMKASNKEMEKAGLGGLREYMKANDFSKDLQEAIYDYIFELMVKGKYDQPIRDYVKSISNDIKMDKLINHNMIEGLPTLKGNAQTTMHSMQANQAKFQAALDEEAEAANRAAEAQKAAGEAQRAKEKAEQDAKDATEARQKKFDNIEKKYEEAVKDANAEFELSKKTQEDLTKKNTALADAAHDACIEFYKLTNILKEGNPYWDKLSAAQQDIMNQRAERLGAPLTAGPALPTAKAVVQNPSSGLALPKFSEKDAEALKAYQEFLSDFQGWDGMLNQMDVALGGVEALTGGINSLASAYSTLDDAEASWAEKMMASVSIFGSLLSMVEGATAAYETFHAIKTAADAADSLMAKKKLAEQGALLAGNTAVAASGAASSVASIPYVGWGLAIAAIASIAGILGAFAGTFANGGVVGGSSMHGDKMIARVNSGEMILNGTQQKNLFNMLKDGGSAQPARVDFHISGKDLVGTMTNYQKSMAVIQSPR